MPFSQRFTLAPGFVFLDSGLVYSRGDSIACATYINSAGVLTAAGTDDPRYNYLNGTLQGLLMEEARTNYIKHSRAFSNAAWLSASGANDNGTEAVNGETGTRVLLTNVAVPDFDSSGALYQAFAGAVIPNANNYIGFIRWAARTAAFNGRIGAVAATGSNTVNSGSVPLSTSEYRRHSFLHTGSPINWTGGGNISMRPGSGETDKEAIVSAYDYQNGTFPTSHIINGATALSRQADYLTVDYGFLQISNTAPHAFLLTYERTPASLAAGASFSPFIEDNGGLFNNLNAGGGNNFCVIGGYSFANAGPVPANANKYCWNTNNAGFDYVNYDWDNEGCTAQLGSASNLYLKTVEVWDGELTAAQALAARNRGSFLPGGIAANRLGVATLGTGRLGTAKLGIKL
jgi:hypothetical protein